LISGAGATRVYSYSTFKGGDVMRMLSALVIVGAVAVGGYTSAQDNPASPKPPYTNPAMVRIFGHTPVSCVLPDKTDRPVDSVVAVDGRTYRCVEVLSPEFFPLGVAWTPVSPQP
jgi:hypothetical protein